MSAPRQVPPPIDTLPAQAVRRLAGRSVEELRHWAVQAGHQFVLVDCSDCVDKDSVLKAIGRAFDFPEWYGANLDALYDCLTDLTARNGRGWIVVLERLPGGPRFSAGERSALLDAFRDAADDFAEQAVGLRLFYS